MADLAIPSAVEAERAFLGAAMIDTGVIRDHIGVVKPSHFFILKHGLVWSVILDVFNRNPDAADVDVVAICEALKSHRDKTGDWLTQVGGPAEISALMNSCPSAFNAPVYWGLIHEAWARRETIKIAEEGATRSFSDSDNDARGIIQDTIQRLSEIGDQTIDPEELADEVPYAERVSRDYAALENRYLNGTPDGPLTGLIELDTLIPNGMLGGQFWGIAGRPGSGKTALMITIALNQARAGIPIGFISMEMGGNEITRRFQGQISGVDGAKLAAATLTDDEWRKYTEAAATGADLALHIRERAALKLWTRFASQAKRLVAVLGCRVLYADYLQLLEADYMPKNARYGNRTQVVTDLSGKLKGLAKELNVPIVAGIQLSRAVDERTDKRPLLSDMRESGAIEQDLDICVGVFREAYYDNTADDTAELLLLKQRNGATGTAYAYFQREITRFCNLRRVSVPLNSGSAGAIGAGDHD